MSNSKGPVILDREVTNAIEALKVGKAIGPDGIPAEFWKVLGAKETKELVELGKEMYVKGIWPSDFTRVVMIPLQKKTNVFDRVNWEKMMKVLQSIGVDWR